MTGRIFKYPLNDQPGTHTIELPIHHTVLCVKAQNDRPILYALVDQNYKEKELVSYFCAWTGNTTVQDGQLDYIGTVLTDEDTHVLHYFLVK